MQSAYLGKLLELAEKDHNVLHILADSGTGFDGMFEKNFPEQIFNFGISEEHMVAAAAGMATVGKIPFVYTAGAFLAYRSFEFIRDDICFQNLNVKIAGMGSGLSWSSLGPTHHTTEDIAVLRSLPNLMILSPATPKQAAACVEKAYKRKGPVYIRIGMNKEKEFFDDEYILPDKGYDVIVEATEADAVLFTTGSILEETVRAAEMLARNDDSKGDAFKIAIWNVNTVKPFNRNMVIEASRISDKMITVEEHQIDGGLGSILNDTIIDTGVHMKNYRIGLIDCFAGGYGKYADVRRENGLDAASIAWRIGKLLRNEG